MQNNGKAKMYISNDTSKLLSKCESWMYILKI
uniref:Uncharacterized protein n=1 Tax=Anguilla anguilla TaxID=7936 RepID=A0A0E9R9N9_ANGAN